MKTTKALLGGYAAARELCWDGVWDIERGLPQQRPLIGFAIRRELVGDTV
jgi:hypothetical protein